VGEACAAIGVLVARITGVGLLMGVFVACGRAASVRAISADRVCAASVWIAETWSTPPSLPVLFPAAFCCPPQAVSSKVVKAIVSKSIIFFILFFFLLWNDLPIILEIHHHGYYHPAAMYGSRVMFFQKAKSLVGQIN
jgi:hypothetical protein